MAKHQVLASSPPALYPATLPGHLNYADSANAAAVQCSPQYYYNYLYFNVFYKNFYTSQSNHSIQQLLHSCLSGTFSNTVRGLNEDPFSSLILVRGASRSSPKIISISMGYFINITLGEYLFICRIPSQGLFHLQLLLHQAVPHFVPLHSQLFILQPGLLHLYPSKTLGFILHHPQKLFF